TFGRWLYPNGHDSALWSVTFKSNRGLEL
ncbi:hypothetical protein NPIL_605591, partial [Nephila pilipes]